MPLIVGRDAELAELRQAFRACGQTVVIRGGAGLGKCRLLREFATWALGVTGEPNPLLDLPIDQPRDVTAVGHFGYQGPGIRSDQVPATLSKVTVNVNDVAGADNRVVALHAGLAGITQDDDGALRPVAGWHVAPPPPTSTR